MKSIIIEKYEEEMLPVASDTSNEITAADFKPTGAIAFFVLLMILCAAIWYAVYYIALSRK